MTTPAATPFADGFAMPAEWQRHERCWMAWPTRTSVFGDRLAAAQRAYAEVASTIAEFEPVTMIAKPEAAAEASVLCGRGVSVLPIEHDDAWARDTCPSFVRRADGALAGVRWRFDGYGLKTPGHEIDQDLARRVLERAGLPAFEAPLVFEGGAIHVDGEGTGLVCAGSALDERRNPGVTRDRVERVMRDFLGVEKLIWLEHALVDDETAGHVDNLACFVRPGAVVALVGRKEDDPDFAGLQDNLARLRGAADAKGRAIEVIEVPQPAARSRDDGRRLTQSYVNFYPANDAVILPVFDDPADKAAIRALETAFPKRTIVPVRALDVLHGGGGIHCITQQQPEAVADA